MQDTTTKEPEDLREVILEARIPGASGLGEITISKHKLFDIIDAYFEVRSMEFLEWLYENDVSVDNGIYGDRGENKFYYKGEWITAKQLFENFL